MVDPRRVVSYNDITKYTQQTDKVIIDVRNPDEVASTGKIPSSINIPLGYVEPALKSMSDEQFRQHYQRNKPETSSEIIFYCKSGKRACQALDTALQLGYSKKAGLHCSPICTSYEGLCDNVDPLEDSSDIDIEKTEERDRGERPPTMTMEQSDPEPGPDAIEETQQDAEEQAEYLPGSIATKEPQPGPFKRQRLI